MTAPDPCAFYPRNLYDAPAASGFLITPAAGDLPALTRGIYVAVSGSPVVVFSDNGTPVTLTGLLAGTVYPFSLTKVTAAGGATLIGLY